MEIYLIDEREYNTQQQFPSIHNYKLIYRKEKKGRGPL
jgi:hypothetical protein